MANKTIKIGNGKKTVQEEKNLEVYVDIDTDSAYNYNYKDLSDVNIEDYTAVLKAEHNPPGVDQAISAIIDESSSRSVNSIIDAIALELSVGYAQAKQYYNVHTGTSKWRISKLINVPSVQNALHQCFQWIPGERIINPEFGSRLQLYLYEGITSENQEKIAAEIRHCVTEWEPRVQIDKITNFTDTEHEENNTVYLRVYYHITGLDDEQFCYTYKYHRGVS